MSTTHSTEPVTREERREVYESVIRTIDAQTSPKQAPGVRRTTLTLLLTPPNGPYDLDAVKKALQAARDHGDVLAWPGAEGRPRYTLATPDKLRQLAGWAFDLERTELVAWANQMVEEVSNE